MKKLIKGIVKFVLLFSALMLVIGVLEAIRNPEKYQTQTETSAETAAPETAAPATPTVEPATDTAAPLQSEEPTTETSRVTIDGYYVEFGEILSVVKDGGVDGTSLIIKAKITPSYSNRATINQNYFNIENLIRDQGATDYSEIQYWAIADMSDGSEGKVISFTVDKNIMDAVADQRIVANQLGDYVSDLWVLPSLLK